MRDAMMTASLPPPEFKTDGMFTVVLNRAVEKTVEKTVEIIIKEMKANPKVTIKQLSELTGLSRRGIEYNISILKDAKKIRRRGSDRSGSWEVSEMNR
jgi:ATP-dependent DNA helicase RecG